MKITIETSKEGDYEAVNKIASTELDKLNAVCFWLIKQCIDTNATDLKVSQDGVHLHGKPIGDWKITIKKQK